MYKNLKRDITLLINTSICCCFVMIQSVRLNVLSKVINNSKYITILTLSTPKWADNVNRDTLKWCNGVNRSKGSTIASVSLVPMARKTL